MSRLDAFLDWAKFVLTLPLKAGELFITYSKKHINVAQKLADANRHIRELEIGMGIDRIRDEYADACRELENVRNSLEQTASDLEDARTTAKMEIHRRREAYKKCRQVEDLRLQAEGRYQLAESVSCDLLGRLATSAPFLGIWSMIEDSQIAALYVNSDDRILFANKEAISQMTKLGLNLRTSPLGQDEEKAKQEEMDGKGFKYLLEVTSEPFMRRLRADIDSRGTGFKIDCPGPFHCWDVTVMKDKTNQLYGYFMKNERGFVENILEDYELRERTIRRDKGSRNVPRIGIGHLNR